MLENKETREALLNAVLGDPKGTYKTPADATKAYQKFVQDLQLDPDKAGWIPIQTVLVKRINISLNPKGTPPTFEELQKAVAVLSGSATPTDLGPRGLDGLSAVQLRKLIELQGIDVFKGLSENRVFGDLLGNVVEKTISTGFFRILQEGAESAVREATLDLLRKCYVSIAAGSKLSDLVAAIENQGQPHGKKPGGGQDGGDGDPRSAGMP